MPEQEQVLAYEEALNAVEALSPTPQILAKTQRKLKDPKVELKDIVEIVRADASLTTDIIRISNSAFYAYETKASNLHEAIHRIGFGEITRLIGLSIFRNLAEHDLTYYAVPQEDYWSSSVSVALIMEHLAQRFYDNPEDAYTVGLLHSVGRLVINQIMEDFKLSTIWDNSTPVERWEREHVGFTFAYAGAMILRRWDFSMKTTHPILYQLNTPRAEIGWMLHAHLYFARSLLKRTGNDLSNDGFKLDEPLEKLMTLLPLAEEDLRSMVADCHQRFIAIRSHVGF